MARIKIELPQSFRFSCYIPVRITDVNYGGHVGNDAILSIIHEARMQFFKSLDYSEMNFAGTAMIMVDVCIEFKGELFYGDTLIASVAAGGFAGRVGPGNRWCPQGAAATTSCGLSNRWNGGRVDAREAPRVERDASLIRTVLQPRLDRLGLKYPSKPHQSSPCTIQITCEV